MTRARSESPFAGASTARKKIHETMRMKTSLRLTLMSEVAACIFGLPADSLKTYGLNALIKTDRKGVNILVADNEEVALQALRNWQNDIDPASTQLFNKAAYVSLYRAVQAGAQGQGKRVAGGSESFFIKLLEETDDSFAGVLEQLEKRGGLDADDQRAVHIKLTQIWDSLAPAEKDTIDSFAPQNLFRV